VGYIVYPVRFTWQSDEDEAIVPTATAPGVVGIQGMLKEKENPSAETSILLSQTTVVPSLIVMILSESV
jgi:hypothetical protein